MYVIMSDEAKLLAKTQKSDRSIISVNTFNLLEVVRVNDF